MPIRLLLCCLVALPTVVVADASRGQFMGYELGTKYPAPPQNTEVTTTGNLLIVAENPTKPADIVQVNLIATPQSRTIGYIVAASWYATEGEARDVGRHYVELLRAKYPDWNFGRELMDASLRIVEVNFDKAPYNLHGCASGATNMMAAVCGAFQWPSVGTESPRNGAHGKTRQLPSTPMQSRHSENN